MGGYIRYPDGTFGEWVEQPYDSEDLLQALLADYPRLLAGDQINDEEPRRWLLISREMGLPSEQDTGARWSVDHLFLDQDAVPTLIEVKRSTDTRIRREVIGQLLEYAVNATRYWQVDRIQEVFEANCRKSGSEPDQVLTGFLGADTDPGHFWQTASLNLQAGKIRLMFVSDEISSELKRIVEFLNVQMNPAEVLAIEIKQYAAGDFRQFTPKLFGQTSEAQDRKSASAQLKKRRDSEWGEEEFLSKLKMQRGPAEADAAKIILDWARSSGFRIAGGKGIHDGSLYPVLDCENEDFWPISMWTYGQITIQFGILFQSPPFDQEAKREEFREYLSRVPDVKIPPDKLTKYPSFPLAVLTNEQAMSLFIDSLDWFLQEVKTAYEI